MVSERRVVQIAQMPLLSVLMHQPWRQIVRFALQEGCRGRIPVSHSGRRIFKLFDQVADKNDEFNQYCFFWEQTRRVEVDG
ncbi:hypothetical protein C5D09_05415 [Rathayibacter sp. AY1C9]|nr:hypothetical protein C5D09_05415 [Rathayibacter sp. AY1C9]